MTFQESIKTCLTKYVDFVGRASRSEYWWFVLFNIGLSVVVSLVSQNLGYLVSLALFLPGLAAAVRRLHDTNRSGWWMLIGFVPLVGGIILIVFLAQESRSPLAAPLTAL